MRRDTYTLPFPSLAAPEGRLRLTSKAGTPFGAPGISPIIVEIVDWACPEAAAIAMDRANLNNFDFIMFRVFGLAMRSIGKTQPNLQLILLRLIGWSLKRVTEPPGVARFGHGLELAILKQFVSDPADQSQEIVMIRRDRDFVIRGRTIRQGSRGSRPDIRHMAVGASADQECLRQPTQPARSFGGNPVVARHHRNIPIVRARILRHRCQR